jgi:hypothetical protein
MYGSIGTVLAIVDSLFGLPVARRDQHNAVLLQWSERMQPPFWAGNIAEDACFMSVMIS